MERRLWKVAAVSSNTGAFGHVSRVIIARNGEAYQCLRVDGPWNKKPWDKSFDQGCEFDCCSALEPYLVARGFEIVERLPDAPPEVIREVWKGKA